MQDQNVLSMNSATTIFSHEDTRRLHVSSFSPGSFWGDGFWTYTLLSIEKHKKQGKLLVTGVRHTKVFVIVHNLDYLDDTDWFKLRYLVRK